MSFMGFKSINVLTQPKSKIYLKLTLIYALNFLWKLNNLGTEFDELYENEAMRQNLYCILKLTTEFSKQ